MLVLTRSIGTQVVIDGRIRITVLRIGGRSVRLGINAPAARRVDRLEVHDRRNQNEEPPRLAAAG